MPARSLEHILPESLGCPKDFVLKNGVCLRCNNKNSKLDRALLKPFELITVMKGIPRKRGRAPTIDGFSTLSSTHGPSGAEIFFNRERFSVTTPSGKRLGPASAKDEVRKFEVKHVNGNQVNVSIQMQLRFGRQAVRGLFKAALESVAYYCGLDSVSGKEFEAVRDFVQRDKGSFQILMMPGGPFDFHVDVPVSKNGRPFVVGMTILGVSFICDFDPSFAAGEELEVAAREFGYGTGRLPDTGVK